MKEESKVKIFVGYHKPNKVFISDVFQPILTADVIWDDDRVIKDDTDINIAEKHKTYAELTGQYWVWKNFMPKTSAEYIGFCHYRRFFDFDLHKMPKVPLKPIPYEEFKDIFPMYTEDTILDFIGDADIILPEKFFFGESIYTQYLKYHPGEDFTNALQVIYDILPEYYFDALDMMVSGGIHICLQFIMKKHVMEDYMRWMFTFLEELERRSDYSNYDAYFTVRMPAYIAERFFNVWLLHAIREKKYKVKTTTSFVLTGESHGFRQEKSASDYELFAKFFRDNGFIN